LLSGLKPVGKAEQHAAFSEDRNRVRAYTAALGLTIGRCASLAASPSEMSMYLT
jgi:hypothetical protein